MLHRFHCFYEDFFLPSTSVHSVTEFIKPVCNSQTPFRSAKVLFIIRDVQMTAFSLYSASNLTLRQIRLCICEKKGGAISLAVSHFIHLIIGKHLQYGIQDIMCCMSATIWIIPHIWDTISIIIFPFILSTNLFDILLFLLYNLTCLWESFCIMPWQAELW